jgi:iron transport multicopper oxidase
VRFLAVLLGLNFKSENCDRCVLTAIIGMVTVVWYSLGGHISEEEMEHEVREHLAAKGRRGRFFGLLGKKS